MNKIQDERNKIQHKAKVLNTKLLDNKGQLFYADLYRKNVKSTIEMEEMA